MQLLGNLFEYELAQRGEELNILGATSGDTGSAAEYAMRGKHGIRVFMLSPHGRMSPFQKAQMFSLQDANIHNIAVDGVFDDCQDIVKAVVERPRVQGAPQDRHGQLDQLGARAWRRSSTTSPATSRRRPRNDAAGDVRRAVGQLRQHLRRPRRAHDGPADPPAGARDQRERRARRVLPHRRLPRARGAETQQTSSPSMDISKASNFERFVFDLLGRDRRGREAPVAAGRAQRRVRPVRHASISRASRSSASSPAAARTPTGWRRSATCIATTAR